VAVKSFAEVMFWPGAREAVIRCDVPLRSTVGAPDSLDNPLESQPTSRDRGGGDRDIQIRVIG